MNIPIKTFLVPFVLMALSSCDVKERSDIAKNSPADSARLVEGYIDSLTHVLAVDPKEAIEKSKAHAASWFALIKDKKYTQSWDAASRTFRSFYPKEQWIAFMVLNYESLGTLEGRQLDTAYFTRNIQGYPVRDFVVLQFKSKFSVPEDSIAEHTVYLKEGRKWKISTFNISSAPVTLGF